MEEQTLGLDHETTLDTLRQHVITRIQESNTKGEKAPENADKPLCNAVLLNTAHVTDRPETLMTLNVAQALRDNPNKTYTDDSVPVLKLHFPVGM
jgi:hypothetical protein